MFGYEENQQIQIPPLTPRTPSTKHIAKSCNSCSTAKKRSALALDLTTVSETFPDDILMTPTASGRSYTPVSKKTCRHSSMLFDRLIPHRAGINDELSIRLQQGNNENEFMASSSLSTVVYNTPRKDQPLLQIPGLTPKKDENIINCRKALASSFERSTQQEISTPFQRRVSVEKLSTPKTAPRSIPSAPLKVLDIPNLENDYYLNLLHWGSNNILAVALNNEVYLWNAETSDISTITTLSEPGAKVTSVQWSPNSQYLAIGTSLHETQLWDVTQQKMISSLQGHQERVSSLSWQSDMFLSSGGRDSIICNFDVRRHRRCSLFSYVGHAQEVCGLTWSHDGMSLASGGNENMLCIWDFKMSNHTSFSPMSNISSSTSYQARLRFENYHTAAVRALAWSPWQRNLLASGGGTADRCIRLWNTSPAQNDASHCIKTVNTGSQVCAIVWSGHQKELVSSHGFTDNQLIVWKYPDMTKMQELRGHSARVLHLAKSPCGNVICSASADETMRFWNVFESSSSKATSASRITGLPGKGMPSKHDMSRIVLPSSSNSMTIR